MLPECSMISSVAASEVEPAARPWSPGERRTTSSTAAWRSSSVPSGTRFVAAPRTASCTEGTSPAPEGGSGGGAVGAGGRGAGGTGSDGAGATGSDGAIGGSIGGGSPRTSSPASSSMYVTLLRGRECFTGSHFQSTIFVFGGSLPNHQPSLYPTFQNHAHLHSLYVYKSRTTHQSTVDLHCRLRTVLLPAVSIVNHGREAASLTSVGRTRFSLPHA